MKKIKDPLKTIAKSLLSLSKKVEKIAKQADALMPSKPVPAAKKTVAKKTAPKKTVAKKTAPKKAVAKKAVAKKTVAKKTAAKKKPPAAKVAPPKQLAVLDSVFDSIKRAKKGVTVAQIKEKLDLNAKQLSNALYKLSKKGKIEAKSRGLYFKK
ncbi:MAG: hypothetical protein QNL11_03725 [Desulfobacterales bacterium]|nr:hypothetical protein [Desulfobacterales bacterium]